MSKDKKKDKVIKAKKNDKKNNESFYVGVLSELKKVRWPLKKEMSKYSISTLTFIIFFALFFMLSDFIIATIKVWV